MPLGTPSADDADSVSSKPSKTRFFSDLAQSVPFGAWWMHKSSGHFNNQKSRQFAWHRSNIENRYQAENPAEAGRQDVLAHVLVVAARVEELAMLLGISGDIRKKLRHAAILHDARKYPERLLMDRAKRNGASEWDAYLQAAKDSDTYMRHRLHWDIRYLANSCGHTTIPEARALLEGDNFEYATVMDDDLNRSWLSLHYVDDITRGFAVVQPATLNPDTGTLENDLDRRMNMNRANPAYTNLNLEGINRDGFGKPTFDVQQEVGHQIEERLFRLIEKQRLETAIQTIIRADELPEDLMQPVRLPEIIDRLVQSRYTENPAD